MLRTLIACAALAGTMACSPAADGGEKTKAAADAGVAGTGDGNLSQAAMPGAGAYAASLDARFPAGQPVTPAEVKSLIEAKGAGPAVTELYGEEAGSRWSTITRGIAKGEQQWIALVPALQPGTQNATDEELSFAITDSLTANAPATLRLLTTLESGEAYCADAGYETPPEELTAFYAAAIAQVEAVDDPALAQIKTACLANLRTGQSAIGKPL